MISLTRWGSAALVALAMAGCGGDGGGSSPVVPPPSASVKDQISAAAAVPANDTASNSSSAFTAVQGAGVTAVTVPASGGAKVNFSVFSDGKVVSNLATSNVSFAIAKLVPGTNGNPDQWVNYVYRTETAVSPYLSNSVPTGTTATQATTDAKMSTTTLASLGLASQLVYNADGYYTYVFATDIRDPKKTNGVVFEPDRTHRVAIQLSYKNAAGETVLVNPYIDFTVDADGKSVFVTDPSKTRKMTDVTSCNGCHDKLALHGGGRVDTQYCVMCHNPGTTDANSGNVLTMSTMIHKIHSGKLLAAPTTAGGEDYVIWGYQNSKHDYAEVGFPQDLRNCSKCHSASNPNTPQGDNWKTKVSKDACLTCHASKPGSSWNTTHTSYLAGGNPLTMTNAQCVACHNPTSNPTLSPERVHWNQNEENAAKYKMNIEDVTYTPSATTGGTSTVTVKYFLSDPTNNNAAYNLMSSNNGTQCVPPASCGNAQFGNLRLVLAYQNMVGQYQAVTEFSAYNNGGSGPNVFAYTGTNNGSNHYTVNLTVPANTTLTAAFGTARVVTYGQIKEVKLQAKSATDPRPPVVPTTLINTVVQHTYKDVALTGSLQPRRAIVSNEKCNVCHGALGTTSGSNIPALQSAFHSGARNTVESCVVCHDPNKASSTVMTSGLVLNESYQFKRMIHGIHGNSKRLYPFTHGNAVVGAFCNPANPLSKSPVCDPNLALASSGVENYGAEVAYPQVGLNCDACHVNGSWKQDLGTLGAMTVAVPGSVTDLSKSTTFSATAALFESSGACVGATGSVAAKTLKCTSVDLNKMPVISPKAATCTACHDSSKSIAHVTSFGGSAYGDKNQAQVGALPRETCNDCHSPGGFKGVDIVHGQK
jgi:OmcA/MtrC family decaheme c-type cytochrome